MAKITAGKYLGKIIEAGIYVPKSQVPMVCLKFEISDREGEIHNVTWFGSTHENSKVYTVETMARCGFSGEDIDDCYKGKAVFDCTKELELVVAIREGQDGKQRPEVKFINNPGGGAFKKMDASEAKAITAGYSIKADLMAARAKMGITATKQAQEEVSEQDILF